MSALGRRLQALLEALGRPRTRLFICALGVVLVLPSIGQRFVFDDNTHALMLRPNPGVVGLEHGFIDLFVFVTGDPEKNRGMIEQGAVLPWWSNPELRLSFFRPLSSFTHYLDHRLWPTSAALMHVHSIAWYAALLFVVARVYQRFCSPPALAGLALLLYALDDAHGQTVSWIANRNALVASTFALLTLLFHDRWRRDGKRWSAVLAPGLLLLGLFGAEFAVGVTAYLFAYALFVDRAPARVRLLSLVPYALIIVVWRVAYRALGYGVAHSDAYIDPTGEPLDFLMHLPKRMLVFLLGQLAAPGADTAFWAPPSEHYILIALALLTLGLLGWLLAPRLKREPVARFWALGLVLATIPVSASFSSDRVLVLVGVGAMPLLAGLFADLVQALAEGQKLGLFKSLAIFGYAVIHVPVAAVMNPIRARSVEIAGRALERADAGIPSDSSIRDKTVIVANAPVDAFVSFIHVMRERRGVPRPAELHSLASATSPLEVTRTADRTLRVRPAKGYLYADTERFWRAERDPLRLGDRIELPTVAVEISALTADGRPAAADFHFRDPLDSNVYVWRSFRDGEYVPWQPPPLGMTVSFPAEDFVKILIADVQRN